VSLSGQERRRTSAHLDARLSRLVALSGLTLQGRRHCTTHFTLFHRPPSATPLNQVKPNQRSGDRMIVARHSQGQP